MTQTTALIVHELMESPQRFLEKGDGTISNGYYMVAMDGSKFGMGSASYMADGAERIMLEKAIANWKEETGWTPPIIQESQEPAIGRRVIVTPDAYSRSAYEDFSRAIRACHKSFMVHKDATVLSKGMESAIMALDLVLKPVEAMEGKPKREQSGGIPSA